MQCPFCGSNRIEIGIAWGQTAEVGNFGLKYNVGSGFFQITGVAQVYSDLCLDCKSLLRTYIKENTNKNWNHESGSIGNE